jgi:hypothetical protein
MMSVLDDEFLGLFKGVRVRHSVVMSRADANLLESEAMLDEKPHLLPLANVCLLRRLEVSAEA